MSKITVTTIAGQTSGADANTVKIESGDTLAVQTNATVGGTLGVTGDATFDTTTLKVDSSNNRVGIGTASPSYTLHSTTSSGTDFAGFFHNSSGSGNSTALLAKGGANNSGAGTFIVQDYGGNEDFKVDGLGRVTKPNNPSFTARSSGGNNGNTWEAGQDIKFQVVDSNVGSHYDSSTGRFTAPVTGIYHFNYSGFAYNGGMIAAGVTSTTAFRVNNVNKIVFAYDQYQSTISYPSQIGSITYPLTANDYVTIRVQAQGQYADGSGLYTHFSGYLVG